MSNKNKNKNIVYSDEVAFFDIETSKIKYHDEEGFELKNPIPQVYLCNVVLIKKEYLNDVNKDNIQIIREDKQEEIDDTKYQCYSYFFRTLEEFINFTKTLKNKTICYVHNLSYEFSFLIRETNNGLDDINYQNIFRGTNDCLKSFLNDIPNVEFRDSLALLGKSIKELGDEIGYPKLEIDYERNLHYYDDLEDNDYDYNERDNIITLLSIGYFLQHKAPSIGIKNVDKLPITSTRYVKNKRYKFAKKYFPKEFDKTTVDYRNDSLDDNLDFYEISKNSFRGGLVSCNKLYMPNDNGNNWLENSCYHIDITSSYIYVMLNTKFPYYSKEKSIEVKDVNDATILIKSLAEGIEKYTSNYMNEYGINIEIDDKKLTEKGIKGFYANVTFKNIRLKNKNDIPSIDGARTSVADDKNSAKLKRFCGKVLEADELSMSLNDATLEAILIDYDFDDIECDYMIYTTESKQLPYFELCFLIGEFFIKQSFKNNKNTKRSDYLLAKSCLNSMFGIKVQDLIKDKITVKNGEVVVSEKAHSIGNDNNKKLFDEYVENNKDNKQDIYSDGVYIATKARLNLVKMKKHLKEKNCNCIYCDTDSLIFEVFGDVEEVFDSIEKYNNKITRELLRKNWIKRAIKIYCEKLKVDEKEVKDLLSTLGTWDYESVDENGNIKPYDFFSTLGPKKYCKCKNGKVETTISGLSKKIANLIEDYAKQQNITLFESAKLIFKNNTTFDETCSGQTIVTQTILDKKFIDTLRDENNRPAKGYGGNLIEKTSFNLSILSDTESLLHSEFEFFAEKNMLTGQTVSIEKGIIKII